MWTATTRRQHRREGLRYETDLTDGELSGDRSFVATATQARATAEVDDARDLQRHLLYVAWRRRLEPSAERPVVEEHAVRLVLALASPRTSITRWSPWIESVSDERSRLRPRSSQPERQDDRERRSPAPGYDAGKKINGRKRHALVDTDGRALIVEPNAPTSRVAMPPARSCSVACDLSLHREAVRRWRLRRRARRKISAEIVRRIDQVGFVVLPRRWVVERFFAWINRSRRLAKDIEATIDSARGFLYAGAIALLVRRIARTS